MFLIKNAAKLKEIQSLVSIKDIPRVIQVICIVIYI